MIKPNGNVRPRQYGSDNEGIVPVTPGHQQARMAGGRAQEKASVEFRDDELTVAQGHDSLGRVAGGEFAGGHVSGKFGIADELRSTRRARFQLLQVAGDVRIGDPKGLVQLSQTGHSLESRLDAYPERCQNRRLLSREVGISEELLGHLAVGFDHGPHGILLGAVLNSVNVNAIHTIVCLHTCTCI